MAKYRKKPVVIDAELYQEGMEDGYACYTISGQFIGFYEKGKPLPKTARKPAIKTLEGFQEISKGDYVLIGVNGEKYLCKPDIFEKTHELVEE